MSDTPVTDRAIEKSREEGVYADARIVFMCRAFERVLWDLAGFLPGHGDAAEVAAQKVRDVLLGHDET